MKCAFCHEKVMGESYVFSEGVLHLGCKSLYYLRLRGLVHKCPKCKTSGKMDHPKGKTLSIWVPVDLGDYSDCSYNGCRGCPHCGEKQKFVIIKVPCDLCDGEGYLKKEPVPIRSVTGWEK